jgi:hypothetical protein
MDNAKYIYESTVEKIVEEKITEKRQENGQEIEVSKTVKTKKPFKISVLKPDRKKFKDAEIFYAKSLSTYLKEGLLPYSLVSKRYMNDGGPLSEDEKRFISTLREKYTKIQEEYFAMPTELTEEHNKRRSEIILEMTEINKILGDIQNNYSELFENTAEAKSKNDTVEWWIINLSCIDEDGKGYKLLYGDADYVSKTKKLEEIEAKDDPFYNEVIKKLSYFISFWYASKSQIKDEEFKSAEKHYNENVTDYLKDEIAEEPKDKPVVAPTIGTAETVVIAAAPEIIVPPVVEIAPVVNPDSTPS